jgi:Mg-chelatase subunit ChlD/type II secretory pathway pseudopilin PulG
MTNDLPPMNRDDLEAKVTALLLGELPESEAALMRELIARDAGLAKLQERLKVTLELLRETAATPEPAPSAPMKLSQDKREKLLAHFKTVAPKEFTRPPARKFSWLTAVAAVFAVGILASMLLPALSRAKTRSQKVTILSNLLMLETAKQQWAAEQGKSATDVPTMDDVLPYLGGQAIGRDGLTYSLGAVGQAPVALLKDRTGKETIVTLPMQEGNLASINEPTQSAVPATLPLTMGGRGRQMLRTAAQVQQEAPSANQIALPVSAAAADTELSAANKAPAAGQIGVQGGSAQQDQSQQSQGQQNQSQQSQGLQVYDQSPIQIPLKAVPSSPANGTAALPVAAAAPVLETAPAAVPTLKYASASEITEQLRKLDELNKSKATKDATAPGAGQARSSFQSSARHYSAGNFGPAPNTKLGDNAAQPLNSDKLGPNTLPHNENAGNLSNGGAPHIASNQFIDRYAYNINNEKKALDTKNVSNLVTVDGAFAGGGGASPESKRTPVTVSGNLQQIDKTDAPLPQPALPPPVPQAEVLTYTNIFSTFSLNVSDAAFKLAQASLQNGVMPDAAGVRSEEFINAFDYRDPEPAPGAPIGFFWERAGDPFAHNRDLLRFSVKTAAQGRQNGRPLNLVLLLDKSGSMERADRVEIIHQALRVLVSQLEPQDTLSVVVFARTARLWVDGVPGNQAGGVVNGLNGLTPEGGTNLEEAMKLAYATALRHYLANGENRVVLLTDGAANLGSVDPEALKKSVEGNRKQGIALDCFGVGFDGYNDNMMETLSRTGNGRYGFINTPEEAATGFAGKLAGALRVAASDVKVQVEFNPNRVTAFRQIGYAKHQLTKEQFRDNSVAAAEIGAAESGNALYTVQVNPAGDGPLCTVRVRFRLPGTGDYQEHAWDVPYTGTAAMLDKASPAMRLAGVSAAFAEWLASSPYAGEVTPDQLLAYLRGVPEVHGADARPKQLEWMIRQAKSMTGK